MPRICSDATHATCLTPRQSGENGGASEQPRNGGGNDVEANPGNNLHVSGLAMRTTDQDLEEIFGKFGKVSGVSRLSEALRAGAHLLVWIQTWKSRS